MRRIIFVVTGEVTLAIIGVVLAMPYLLAILIFFVPLSYMWLFATSDKVSKFAIESGIIRPNVSNRYYNALIALALLLIGVIGGLVAWDDTVAFSHTRLNKEPPNNRYLSYKQFLDDDTFVLFLEFGVNTTILEEPLLEANVGADFDKGKVIAWSGTNNSIPDNPNVIPDNASSIMPNISKAHASLFSYSSRTNTIQPDRAFYFRLVANNPFEILNCQFDPWPWDFDKHFCGNGVRLINLTPQDDT